MSLVTTAPGRFEVIPNSMSLYNSLMREADKRHENAEIDRWRRKNLIKVSRDLQIFRIAEKHGIPTFLGTLYLRRINTNLEQQNWMLEQGLFKPENRGDMLQYLSDMNISIDDFGFASCRVVTTAGAGFVIDAFQNIVELETMKYHGTGSDNTPEASGQTALVAEFTTELSPNSTRATGTTAEGSSANIYSTVGTNAYDSTVAIVEHGILSQAATGGGVMFDRTVFATVNITSGNALESTYQFTLVAGS